MNSISIWLLDLAVSFESKMNDPNTLRAIVGNCQRWEYERTNVKLSFLKHIYVLKNLVQVYRNINAWQQIQNLNLHNIMYSGKFNV
jgi:hypothetical protein